MVKFTQFLLSWKQDITAGLANPHQLEDFLLTVGLAYRDMITLHPDGKVVTKLGALPEYMNSSRSLLTPRIKAACDSLLRTTSEALKQLQVKPLVDEASVGHNMTNSEGTVQPSENTISVLSGSSHKYPKGLATSSRRETPIILPCVKARKRGRTEPQSPIMNKYIVWYIIHATVLSLTSNLRNLL